MAMKGQVSSTLCQHQCLLWHVCLFSFSFTSLFMLVCQMWACFDTSASVFKHRPDLTTLRRPTPPFSFSFHSDDHPTVPAKVQHLADSLQHISVQLNTVLEALSSLAQKKAPLLPNVQASYQPLSVPLSQEQAISSGLLSGSRWSSARMGASNLGRAGNSFIFQKEPSGK